MSERGPVFDTAREAYEKARTERDHIIDHPDRECSLDEYRARIADAQHLDGQTQRRTPCRAQRRRRVNRLEAVKLAVLGHHVADGNGSCISCWDFNNDTDVKYPCPTVIDLEDALKGDDK